MTGHKKIIFYLSSFQLPTSELHTNPEEKIWSSGHVSLVTFIIDDYYPWFICSNPYIPPKSRKYFSLTSWAPTGIYFSLWKKPAIASSESKTTNQNCGGSSSHYFYIEATIIKSTVVRKIPISVTLDFPPDTLQWI